MQSALDSILPEICALRHELHQHPEIRFQEHWTSSRITTYLEALGIPYESGFAKGTGIVATLQGEAGPTVALRADMDALEITEATGLPYTSHNEGYMHACGHDGHMAILCGVAKVLGTASPLHGTVKLIFQPAEEMAAGGKLMVEEGALDGVEAAFALHGWPGLAQGKVGLRSGPIMASGDFFEVTIHGRGGHAANPGSTIDPIFIAAQIITALQGLVSRELNPWDAGVISVTQIQGGTAGNIIPDTARLGGTFRALSPALRTQLWEGIQRVCTQVATSFRASVEVRLTVEPYPPLNNHPGLTAFSERVLSKALGREALYPVDHPFMTSEDFAFYAQKVPSTFLFLGTDAPGDTDPAQLHTDTFDFNDAALPIGITSLVSLACGFLQNPPAESG